MPEAPGPAGFQFFRLWTSLANIGHWLDLCYFFFMKKNDKTAPQARKNRPREARRAYPVPPAGDGGGLESFPENPFKILEKSHFPKGKVVPAQICSPQEEADREMFIKAVLNEPPPKRAKSRPAFTLADQCCLPELKAAKSGKKPPSKAAAPTLEKTEGETDESAAFLLAMRKTRPLSGKGRDIAPKPPSPPKRERSGEEGFEDLLAAQLEFTLCYSDEYLEGKVASLDELIMNRLREGQMSPEAHLDLHGLNAEQAFEAMRIFIRDSWFKSLRVVLLVTGRGKNSPSGQGVLRRKVQEWLTHEPFKRVVLAFCTAQPHDGGPGSVYVLLRKFRKKGHISWNRLPADADLYEF